jgi:hypothetical protein
MHDGTSFTGGRWRCGPQPGRRRQYWRITRWQQDRPSAAVRYGVSAGQEALRLAAAQDARVHLEQARQEPWAKTEFEAHIRDLYAQLVRADELNGQAEQAAAIYAEMERLALKQSS